MAEVEVRLRNEANTTGTTALAAHDVVFQVVPNRPGSGSFKIANTVAHTVAKGSVVQFLLGGTAEFPARVARTRPTLVSVGDESVEATEFVCAGLVDRDFSKSVVHAPSSVVEIVPPVDDRVFAWYGPDYDPAGDGWVNSTVMAVQGWGSAFYTGLPAGWLDPAASWIWDSTSSTTNATSGTCLFRQVVAVSAGALTLHYSCDNGVVPYVNGRKIPGQSDFREKQSYQFAAVTSGDIVLAFECVNAPDDGPPGDNPAGLLWSLTVGPDGPVVARSGTGCQILAYPSVDPPVQLGKMVIGCMAGNSLLSGWTTSFTGLLDSAGVAFNYPGDLSFRIGRDSVWDVLSQLVDVYVDVYVDVTGKVINLYNKGTLGGTSGLVLVSGYSTAGIAAPASVNVTDLAWDTIEPEANALEVRWSDGRFTRPVVLPSPALWGSLELGGVTSAWVAQGIAEGLLDLYGVDQDTASFELLPVSSSQWPFTAFGVWDTQPVPGPLDMNTTTDQKIAAVTVRGDADGDAVFVIEVGSLVEDRQTWLERAASRGVGAGSLAGRGSAAQPALVVPASASVNTVSGEWALISAVGQSSGATRKRTPPRTAQINTLRLQGAGGTGTSTVAVYVAGVLVATLTGSTANGVIDVEESINVPVTTTTVMEFVLTTVNHPVLDVYAGVSEVFG